VAGSVGGGGVAVEEHAEILGRGSAVRDHKQMATAAQDTTM